MITEAIMILFIVSMVVTAKNGEWGAFAVGAAIVVVLLVLRAAIRKSNRAYGNFVNYWAKGGPDKKR